MYSPFYNYYQIRKDDNFSEKVNLKPVKSTILNLEGIEVSEKNENLCFRNKPEFPFISMALIFTKDGNYAVSENTHFEEVNLIEVITSKLTEKNKSWYLNILKRIANFLNWDIILELDT